MGRRGHGSHAGAQRYRRAARARTTARGMGRLRRYGAEQFVPSQPTASVIDGIRTYCGSATTLRTYRHDDLGNLFDLLEQIHGRTEAAVTAIVTDGVFARRATRHRLARRARGAITAAASGARRSRRPAPRLARRGEDSPLASAQRGAVANQRRNRGAGSADGQVGTGTPHAGARLALPVATLGPASGSGRLRGCVVADGADERLGGGLERLGAAGGAAEDQRALQRRDGQVGEDPGAVMGMPSGSNRVTSAARHRANTLSKSALNSSSRGASSRTMVAIGQPLW